VGATPEARPLLSTLHVDAGVSILPFLTPVSVEFEKLHPEAQLEIEEHRTPEILARLIEKGDVALGAVGRRVKREEFESGLAHGKVLHMTAAVGEGIAVVVAAKNPLVDIRLEQIAAVFFTGKISDWGALTAGAKQGPIHVVAMDVKATAQGEMFANVVARGAAWVAGAKVLDNPRKVPAALDADPDAIGFLTRQLATQASLKILSVDGVAPIDRTVFDETYPLSRRLYWITDGPPEGLAAEFIKYTLSEPGQRLARAQGYTPLSLED
jgi:phosphate transport system substrate-binding protein